MSNTRITLQYTLIGVCMLFPYGGSIAQTQPNILCILVDDLGYGDLACQGAQDMETPFLDQLSASGLTFTQFYANSPVCSPSRASLMTGKYPDLAGVPGVIRQWEANSWGYLDPQATTLPEVLNRAGYHTAMVGKWHLGFEAPNTPNERGFDFFKGFLGDMMDDYVTHLRGGVNWMRENETEIHPEGHATDLFTDWSLDYLKQQVDKEEPFFLLLTYNAPHFPIQPPQEYLDRVLARESGLSEKRAQNVAFIEHLDASVGRITSYLRESGLDENTLVVFTSDNGGALRYEQRNEPLRGGKQEMYEGGIRVPTFFSWKGKIPPGARTNNMGMLIDLYATFAEVAGSSVPREINGISLLPTLQGTPQNTQDRFVVWVRREGGRYGGNVYFGARQGNLKLVYNTPYEPMQFFNLQADPYEQTPLDPKGPYTEQINELRSKLQAHIQRSGQVPWQAP